MSSRTANLLKALAREEQQNKETLLRALLWLNATTATAGFIFIVVQNFLQVNGTQSSRLVYLGLALGALPNWLFIWLDKRIPYTIRAAFPIAINVLFSLVDFGIYGVIGDA